MTLLHIPERKRKANWWLSPKVSEKLKMYAITSISCVTSTPIARLVLTNTTEKTTPPVSCPNCSQSFNNLSSLWRYRYLHSELKYLCRAYNKSFAFDSDFNNHKLKHRHNPGHQCQKEVEGKTCGSWFFAKSDLTKHMKIHLKIVHEWRICN